MKIIHKVFIVIMILAVALLVFNRLSMSTQVDLSIKNVSVQNISSMKTAPITGITQITKTSGNIIINATVSPFSSSIPVYHGEMGENDSIDLQLQSTLLVRQNVTSAKDAPEVVKRLLQPYGGLPADAVMTGAGTNYGEYFQNGTRIAKKPTSTTVTYTRLINGMGIIGDNNRIRVEIGENELLWYFKEWRNYTYIGDVSIISPQTAIEKLKQEELIDSSIHPEDGNITIDMIILGYYAKKTGENDTILEPIWMFYGKSSARSRLGLYVYARQFANFTATPVIATRSEEITFKDISDASPTRRLWDFGDGTNSTLRNPVHAYQKTGTYNISLKVWTDLGSDSLQKINYITYTLSKQ
jgi:PKD repeat protein